MTRTESIESFAKTIYKIAKSNRDVTLGCSGFTGEGKSVFCIKLQQVYANISKTKWSFDHLTWDRDELMKWIEGDINNKGQKPEYSALLPDELISMFYRRNWYEDKQKNAIELFNKCRDRHLFIAGCVPNFWHLDPAFSSRMRFYVYIPRGRARAWVFEQEDNPFSDDLWNKSENQRLFRKNKRNPYRIPNFICEINYPNLNGKEDKEYNEIRRTKRVFTENQNKIDNTQKYRQIKIQRDIMIRKVFDLDPKTKSTEMSKLMNGALSDSAIRLIRDGDR
ncbi:hypothetical protein LCGC14_1351280 [marine sediment metagenome]|uniref:Zona occludens toxin N-terminal domain-containing protein n=1 Tax=marine sediment metagenome TaxID=412755 RepID=A0A0F9KAW8_9ZZZZ